MARRDLLFEMARRNPGDLNVSARVPKRRGERSVRQCGTSEPVSGRWMADVGVGVGGSGGGGRGDGPRTACLVETYPSAAGVAGAVTAGAASVAAWAS